MANNALKTRDVDRVSSYEVAIARLLGLKRPDTYTAIKLANTVSEGLPPSTVSRLVERGYGKGVKLRRTIIVADSTIRNAENAGRNLGPKDSDRLYQHARLIARLRSYLGTDENIRTFLTREHMLLDDECPVDLIAKGAAGIDAVISVIDQAEAGLPI